MKDLSHFTLLVKQLHEISTSLMNYGLIKVPICFILAAFAFLIGFEHGDAADADMDGFFDEMGVWNVALDYGAVLDLYNNNVGISWLADTQDTGPMQHLMQISGGLM